MTVPDLSAILRAASQNPAASASSEDGRAIFDAVAAGDLPAVLSLVADRAEALERRAALVDRLREIGLRLTAQLDLDSLVQDATDTATSATGAAFGAFFYNLVDEYGESYTLYTLSGVPRQAFEAFPMPRNTKVFAPTFTAQGTVRSDDITQDPRFGQNEPYHGMPRGHLPVTSYLADVLPIDCEDARLDSL